MSENKVLSCFFFCYFLLEGECDVYVFVINP